MENNINKLIGNTDIYLLDQILKSRYKQNEKILDVGCGNGRNMHWFHSNGFDIYGVDRNKESIDVMKKNYKNISSKLIVSEAEKLPFKEDYFNHIICNAVLHFAENSAHFSAMFSEMIRVLKNNGTLFIRMTSKIGIENKIELVSEGVYLLPDTSHRFLLTKVLLEEIMTRHKLTFLEPLKTVNVDDLRCMSTLVLQKQN